MISKKAVKASNAPPNRLNSVNVTCKCNRGGELSSVKGLWLMVPDFAIKLKIM